jgi:hypothetical protein
VGKRAPEAAFAKTEEPLGWYFAGKFSKDAWEQFEFYKKSAEGGCSWGQAQYGWYFEYGAEFVEDDKEVYVEWLEKAADQNNPMAMNWLGDWFRFGAGISYYRAASGLGWKSSMGNLASMFRYGEECVEDLSQAAIWSAKGNSSVFWNLQADAKRALESGAADNLGCNFDQLCYSLGWVLFGYRYETGIWTNHLLDFYCFCV